MVVFQLCMKAFYDFENDSIASWIILNEKKKELDNWFSTDMGQNQP